MTRTLLMSLAAATLLLAGLATPVLAHDDHAQHATAHDTYFHPIFGHGPKHGHVRGHGYGKHRARSRHHGGVRYHVSHGWIDHSRYRAWQRELRYHDRHWGRDCVFRHTPHRHVSRRGRIVIDFNW
jgi:hypothetical protein